MATDNEDVEHRSRRLVSRRHVLMGGALVASSAFAFARQPHQFYPPVDKEVFEDWVPKTFEGWNVVGSSGVVLPPPDALSDRLYDNLVTRVYDNSRFASIMLLLAYNNLQDGVVQVHRPEVCYPVGGYELSKTKEVDIATGLNNVPANFFTAKGVNRTEQVLYFTRLGRAYPRNWGEQRWSVIQANLAGRIPDGMMMRVSLLGQDQARALGLLKEFASSFIAASPPALRKLLLV